MTESEIRQASLDMALRGEDAAEEKFGERNAKRVRSVVDSFLEKYDAETVVRMLKNGYHYDALAFSLAVFKNDGVDMDQICKWLGLIPRYSLVQGLLLHGATPKDVLQHMDSIDIQNNIELFIMLGMDPNEIAEYIDSLDAIRGDLYIDALVDYGVDMNIVARNLRLNEYLDNLKYLKKVGVVDKSILVDKIRAADSLDGPMAAHCRVYREEMIRAIDEVVPENERMPLLEKVLSAKPYDFSAVRPLEKM